MLHRTNRREMLKTSALTGVGFWVASRPDWAAARSPNEKLNIAGIGIGGQGASDLREFTSENIVALCDVDWAYAGKTFDNYPKAKKYKDEVALTGAIREQSRPHQRLFIRRDCDPQHRLAVYVL